jgi:hypothetical protein
MRSAINPGRCCTVVRVICGTSACGILATDAGKERFKDPKIIIQVSCTT